MFSFTLNGRKTSMNESCQEVFNSGRGAFNPEKVINVEVSNIPANTEGLQVHRVDAVDTVQEGGRTEIPWNLCLRLQEIIGLSRGETSKKYFKEERNFMMKAWTLNG